MRGVIYYLGVVLFICLFFATPKSAQAKNVLSVYSPAVSKALLANHHTAPSNLSLSEVMPKSYQDELGVEGKEFIEIYNNSNQEADLTGWKLTFITLDNKTSSYTFSAIKMDPFGYLTLSYYAGAKINLKTNLRLNDEGGTIGLSDYNGKQVNEIKYQNPAINHSYSFIDDQWQWTGFITPGLKNQANLDQTHEGAEVATNSISAARENSDGKELSVVGVVTAIPGSISDSYFYIQDETGGLQVYSYHHDFPALKAGDRVKVKGSLSTVAGERRIKIMDHRDIEKIASDLPPAPKETSISQINESSEGVYAEVSGLLIQSSGNQFTIADGAGHALKAIVRQPAVVGKPKLRKGDKVLIRGIVSQYKNEYRILPFERESVKVLASGYLPKAGPSESLSLLCGSIIYWLCISFQKAKRKPLIWAKKLPQRSKPVKSWLCLGIWGLARQPLSKGLRQSLESKRQSLARLSIL